MSLLHHDALSYSTRVYHCYILLLLYLVQTQVVIASPIFFAQHDSQVRMEHFDSFLKLTQFCRINSQDYRHKMPNMYTQHSVHHITWGVIVLLIIAYEEFGN